MSEEWSLLILAVSVFLGTVTLLMMSLSLDRLRKSIVAYGAILRSLIEVVASSTYIQKGLIKAVANSKGCALEPLPPPDSTAEEQ